MMGTLQKVAIVVLVISFFTFVAFFGRLPALRYALDSHIQNLVS
jgi:palmitoyltransferase